MVRRRSVARNASLLAIASGSNLGLAFVSSVIVARILGPADFGVLALVLVWTQVVFRLCNVRPWDALIKFLTQFIHERDQERSAVIIKLAVGLSVVGGLLAFLIVAVAAAYVARPITGEDGAPVWAILAAAFAFLATPRETLAATLRVYDRFGAVATNAIVTAALHGGLTVAAVWLGLGLTGFFGAKVVAEMVGGGLLYVSFQRVVRTRLEVSWIRAPLATLGKQRGELVAFVRSTYLMGVVGALGRDFEVVVLGFVGSTSDVGIFRLAKQFYMAIFALGDPVMNALYPDVAARWLGDRAALSRFLVRVTGSLLGLSVLGAGVGIVVAPTLITAVAGNAFAAAGPVFQIMIVTIPAWIGLLWLPGWLFSAGKPNRVLRAVIVGTSAKGALSVTLIPAMGAIGAAVAVAVASFIYPVMLLLSFVRLGGLQGGSEPAPQAGSPPSAARPDRPDEPAPSPPHTLD